MVAQFCHDFVDFVNVWYFKVPRSRLLQRDVGDLFGAKHISQCTAPFLPQGHSDEVTRAQIGNNKEKWTKELSNESVRQRSKLNKMERYTNFGARSPGKSISVIQNTYVLNICLKIDSFQNPCPPEVTRPSVILMSARYARRTLGLVGHCASDCIPGTDLSLTSSSPLSFAHQWLSIWEFSGLAGKGL